MRRSWTDEEEELVRKYYPTIYPLNKITELIPRHTLDSTMKKALALKVYRAWCKPPPSVRTVRLKLRNVDKVWLAAAIDFEGSIGFHHNSQRNQYLPEVAVWNTNEELIAHVKELIEEAKIYKRRRKENHSAEIHIAIRQMHVIFALLKEVVPFLIAKKKQAELMLEFIKLRDKRYREIPNPTRKLGYTKREIEIIEEMRRLNTKGTRK
jgi:hypothetical protein